MKQTKKAKEIHKAYLLCQEIFSPSEELEEQFSFIEDEDEKLFYRKMSDFFLQQKQKEAIKKGVF